MRTHAHTIHTHTYTHAYTHTHTHKHARAQCIVKFVMATTGCGISYKDM